MPKRSPKAAPVPEKRDEVHEQLQQRLAELVALIDGAHGAVQGGDCAAAIEHYQQAAPVFRRAARFLSQASSIDSQIRRRGLPAARASSAAPSCSLDRPECSYTVTGGACTITAALTVPARGGSIGTERIPARYCVVEVTDLVTSHDPLRGFSPDPRFPPVAQERDYRLDAERLKVESIAGTFEPALIFNTGPGALDGPPVVNEERLVLGGNGRTMAMRLVYAGRGGVEAGEPRQYLIEHAHEFGIDPDLVAQFSAPVVVRTVRVENDPRTLAEWSRRLNTPLSQQLDATRLAVSRARFVDDSVLRELGQMEDDEPLSAFLASSRSKGFVRALQRSGIIDGRASQLYLTEGLLNEAGRNLAADLLVAVLVPDADLIGAWGKGPVATLARAAPSFVQAADWPAYDLRRALQLVVRDRVTMRAQEIESVADYLRQVGMFAGNSPAVSGDPIATALLHVVSKLEGSPAKLTKFARRYVASAKATATGQAGLFAGEDVSPIDAIKRAAADVGLKLP